MIISVLYRWNLDCVESITYHFWIISHKKLLKLSKTVIINIYRLILLFFVLFNVGFSILRVSKFVVVLGPHLMVSRVYSGFALRNLCWQARCTIWEARDWNMVSRLQGKCPVHCAIALTPVLLIVLICYSLPHECKI